MRAVAASADPADTRGRMPAADTDNPEEADEALMLAYARGDAAAFGRLYARQRAPTYRYFLRRGSAATIPPLSP